MAEAPFCRCEAGFTAQGLECVSVETSTTTAGPMTEIFLFRPVNSAQLWTRFVGGEDFRLWRLRVTRPDGQSKEQDFEGLGFTKGFEDVFLLSERSDSGFDAGSYTVEFDYTLPSSSIDAKQASFTATTRAEFYRGPRRFALHDRFSSGSLHYLELIPDLNGEAYRFHIYRLTTEGASFKAVTWVSPPYTLRKGEKVQFALEKELFDDSSPLLVAIEGMDSDAQYTFFSAIELPAR